jgi:hypothetical protein
MGKNEAGLRAGFFVFITESLDHTRAPEKIEVVTTYVLAAKSGKMAG